MGNFVGPMHLAPGAFNVVDSAAAFALGTRAFDGSGNEFIYMAGATSTAIGTVVTFDEAYATTLGAADAVGPVAVAMSACVANKYGWYQVGGLASALTAGDVVDNADVYLAAGGTFDDAVVAGDRVKGALFRAARTGAGLVNVQLFGGPFVENIAD